MKSEAKDDPIHRFKRPNILEEDHLEYDILKKQCGHDRHWLP